MSALKLKFSTKPETRILPLITDTVFILLAVYFVLGYVSSLLAYTETQSPFPVNQLFFLFYQLTAITFMLVRNKPVAFSSKVRDYVYALVGLSAPIFFRPIFSNPMSFAGLCLEFLGAVFVVGAFMSLNKSFGIAPENRGVKTTGMYRIVRHPMYLGYVLAETGFVSTNFSYFNLCILAISISFLVLRLRAEERLLSEDSAYLEYAGQVRWKLLPYVF